MFIDSKKSGLMDYATIAIEYSLSDVSSVKNVFPEGTAWAAAEGIRVAVPAGTMTPKDLLQKVGQALCAPVHMVATQPYVKFRYVG